MSDALRNMKQIQLEDVQENFEQIFEDVLASGESAKIVKDTGNAILVSEGIWRNDRNAEKSTLICFNLIKQKRSDISRLPMSKTCRQAKNRSDIYV